jgi:hypothetical protein
MLSSCAMMQSIVKSTFPYTTTVIIPPSSNIGAEQSVTGMATSFDQDFTKDGNNANKVNAVRIVSARLQSKAPSDFNIGNLKMIKVYMSKPNGEDEVLVASRTDITHDVGNSMVLDIDNSEFLDKLVREPEVKVRLLYRLRNAVDIPVNLHLILGLGAYPAD